MKNSIKVNCVFFKITVTDVDTCKIKKIIDLSTSTCDVRTEKKHMENKYCYCLIENKKVKTFSQKKDSFKLAFKVVDGYLYSTNTCSCDEKDAFQTKIKIKDLMKKKVFYANATVKIAHEDSPFQEGTIFRLKLEKIPNIKSLVQANSFFKTVDKTNLL